jgi:hypothetical protein
MEEDAHTSQVPKSVNSEYSVQLIHYESP